MSDTGSLMTASKTIGTEAAGRIPLVLIHGAWQGSWAWNALIPHLIAAGFPVHAVDLPGNGTDDTPPGAVSLDVYVDHVLSLMEWIGRPVALVAHSGGGVIASQVAETVPGWVDRLVYVAGMMLPDGMGFADLVAELLPEYPEVAGIGPHLEWSADRLTSRVPEAAAMAFFFDDCPVETARMAARSLTPQPEAGRAVRPHLTADRFGRIPRLYVEASADRSVVPILQRRMQALVPGAAVATLPTGHAPQVAAPALLAETLIPFLAG